MNMLPRGHLKTLCWDRTDGQCYLVATPDLPIIITDAPCLGFQPHWLAALDLARDIHCAHAVRGDILLPANHFRVITTVDL